MIPYIPMQGLQYQHGYVPEIALSQNSFQKWGEFIHCVHNFHTACPHHVGFTEVALELGEGHTPLALTTPSRRRIILSVSS